MLYIVSQNNKNDVEHDNHEGVKPHKCVVQESWRQVRLIIGTCL